MVSRRIIIIDDNQDVHDSFKMVFKAEFDSNSLLDSMDQELFGGSSPKKISDMKYELDFAYQGKDGLAKVEKALADSNPYLVAFIDMRMPPGWDGLETAEKILKADNLIQIVFCSAYSDYDWSEIANRLGTTDRVLFLKKPFESIEVLQLSLSLTEKWFSQKLARAKMREIIDLVDQRTRELKKANDELKVEIENRKLAEVEIKEREEKFRTLFESSRDAIFVYSFENGKSLKESPELPVSDSLGQFVEVNDVACIWLGLSREELLKLKMTDLGIPEVSMKIAELHKFLRHQQKAESEFMFRKKSGEDIPVEASAYTFELKKNNMILLIVRDISERRNREDEKEKIQKQLMHTSKLAALGELAGGVAHELNNPLAVIQTYSDQIADILQESGQMDEAIDTCFVGLNRNIQRMIAIISHLKQFGRQSKNEVVVLDVHQTIESALSLYERQFKNKNIVIERKLNDEPLFIAGDQIQLEQIFVNLLSNAKDALESSKDQRILIRTWKEKDSVVVQFEDSGKGVPTEVREKIFDPFFTTKEIGKGTGLGLSVIHGIMKDHNGEISLVEKGILPGAKFRIIFPLANF